MVFKMAAASVCVATCLVWGAVHHYSSTPAVAEQATIATVNGDPIAAEEFERVLRLQRASVIEYYMKKYETNVDGSFWNTNYNGEVPAETARQKALQANVKIKIQLSLAQGKGLIPDSSYHFLMKEMAKENERRSKAMHAGKPVYGPVKLDVNAFFDYYLSRLADELEDKLSEHELAVTDGQLQSYYETVKDPLFKLEDTVKFERIAIPYRDEVRRGGNDGDNKQQAMQAMQAMLDIKQQLEKGEDIDNTIAEVRTQYRSLDLTCTEEMLTNESARTYAKREPALYAQLKNEPAAQPISDIIDDAMNGDYVLFKVLERKPGGYKSFADNIQSVRKQYLDTAYAAYVNGLVKEAKVEINENNYKRVTIE